MKNGDEDTDIRTVFCGNLSENVTEGILFELFNQAGPVESVRRPKDSNGRPRSYGFVVFKHVCSVPYSIELFKQTKLFNRFINVSTRHTYLHHIPVLDTHLNNFNELTNVREQRKYHIREEDHRDYRTQKGNRSGSNSYLKDKRIQDRASSWAELKNDPLHGNKFVANDLEQDSSRDSNNHKDRSRRYEANPVIPNFDALLQMSQQMVIPGIMGFNESRGMPNMMPIQGLGPALGNIVFPSMKEGEWQSTPREGKHQRHENTESRRGNYRTREDRREFPHDNRSSSNNWEEHKRHDRGHSSLYSSRNRGRRSR